MKSLPYSRNEPEAREAWLRKHSGHEWSFNEEGCMTYPVAYNDDGSVTVDSNDGEGTVERNYLFCETCYDKPDAIGPSITEVHYE